MAGPDAEARVGNALPLANIPLGTTIHNIELVPGKGGQIVRSAGVSAQLLAKEGEFATVRLPSGEMRRVPLRPGGVPVRHEGKVGVIYDESPELKAFHRWQQGRQSNQRRPCRESASC